jgi:arylsulfatase A-like enzyme
MNELVNRIKWLCCLLGSVSVLAFAQAQGQRPNVVIFFTDDTGYCDIGPFGGAAPTPHLDKMAQEGMKLTSFYVASVACSPSRSALLTGTYASRVSMDGGVPHAGYSWGLNPSEVTIAEMFKDVGYATACIGKWHLGDQPGLLPNDQGFDVYEGIPYSNDMWDYNFAQRKAKLAAKGKKPKREMYPLPWMKNRESVAWIDGPLSQALMNDVIADAAERFIDENKDSPFFLYIPFPSTHNPKFALEKQGQKIASLGCPEKEIHKYAQIMEIDACVGKVMSALERNGLSKNTFMFYTNDNGGSSKWTKPGTIIPRGGKFGPVYEGNMKMSTLAWWPGKISGGVVSDAFGVTIDLYPTLAKWVGGQVPKDRTIDGKDISDVFFDKGPSPHEFMYYESLGVRRGPWKLVTYKHRVKKGQPATFHEELYHLEKDPKEKNNIAAQQPEMLSQLKKALAAHQADLKKNIRERGDMKTEGPLLKDPSGLPTLAQYLGREHEKIYKAAEK